MVTKKPINWFLTERGRQFSWAVLTGAGIGLAAARYTPHTIFLDKYKDFVHYYKNGKPVTLTDELQKKYEQCLNILNIHDVQKKLASPFSVYGFDLFHAGSFNSKFGVAVGIPVNFYYKSIEDVKKDDIQVNQKPVDWDSPTGRKLGEALVLPEKVQQFALCRELLMTKNNKIIFDSIYPFVSIFFVYNVSQYLNRRLNLYQAPVVVRGTLYIIMGLFGFGTYFLMKDMTEVHYETQVDKKLCELGPEFIESGLIFYDKLLQRNQALRELMGKEGEIKYSKRGNENYFMRQPRIALYHRRQFFQEQLNQLKNKSDTPSEFIE